MNDKDIKILEEFIKYYEAEAISRKFRGTLSIQVDEDDIQAIENLLKENEKLKIKIQFINKNNLDDLYEKALEKTMTKFLNDNIEKDFIPVAKIKEIVDKCVPRGKNIITDEEEYQPNTNANSFLTHEILELLEGK